MFVKCKGGKMFNINTPNGTINLTVQEVKDELASIKTKVDKEGELQGHSVKHIVQSKLDSLAEKWNNMTNTFTKALRSEIEPSYEPDFMGFDEEPLQFNIANRKLENLSSKELSDALNQIREQIPAMSKKDQSLYDLYNKTAKSFNMVHKDVQVDANIALKAQSKEMNNACNNLREYTSSFFSLGNQRNSKEELQVMSSLNYFKDALKNIDSTFLKNDHFAIHFHKLLHKISVELKKTGNNAEEEKELERLIDITDELNFISNEFRRNNKTDQQQQYETASYERSGRIGVNAIRQREGRAPIDFSFKHNNGRDINGLEIDRMHLNNLLDGLKQLI